VNENSENNPQSFQSLKNAPPAYGQDFGHNQKISTGRVLLLFTATKKHHRKIAYFIAVKTEGKEVEPLFHIF
jgi:hypothetical protein